MQKNTPNKKHTTAIGKSSRATSFLDSEHHLLDQEFLVKNVAAVLVSSLKAAVVWLHSLELTANLAPANQFFWKMKFIPVRGQTPIFRGELLVLGRVYDFENKCLHFP